MGGSAGVLEAPAEATVSGWKARYASAPAGAAKPARRLSQSDAAALVVHLVANGHLSLEKEPVLNSAGELVYPRAGKGVVIEPPEIAGVSFELPGHGALRRVGQLNLAFVVLLYRLAAALKKDWGATCIYYGGLGSGGGQCHKDGRAIDFYGAIIRGNRKLTVKQDWPPCPSNSLPARLRGDGRGAPSGPLTG
jgi:hypothetical protein